jgi:CelD/BcsL family acetyltransferase involved in cellulose biosynthesis
MSKGDLLIERGAQRLSELSRKAAAKGGFAAKFADDLAEDAVFLRKLKPSLIAARARGQAPRAQAPASEPERPAEPQIATPRPDPKPKRKAKSGRRRKGPNPFVVAGAALAAGILLAKVIDWRGHAHPRD